jgi:heptosyltransferase-2
MDKTIRRILIVRTDRIGDVLLTTPVAAALRAHFPQARIGWWVRSYTAPLLENNPDADEVIVDRAEPVGEIIARLRKGGYDAAVVAYPRFRVAWALYRAGIPVRIGPASKWYSLFFNRRIWQHRSEGAKHEADYNLELLAPLGVPFRRYSTRFYLTADERARAKKNLEGYRISFQKPVVILHPGSGGSSGRWPLSHFMELGDLLQEMGCDVIVTGGPGEDYQYAMIDNMRRSPVFIAAGSLSLRELAAIFSWANLVVSNSTGPLHIAVALNVPTVSVFSSITTCHPRRWGPYPDFVEGGNGHKVILEPDIKMPRTDLSAVAVENVLAVCRQQLKTAAATN